MRADARVTQFGTTSFRPDRNRVKVNALGITIDSKVRFDLRAMKRMRFECVDRGLRIFPQKVQNRIADIGPYIHHPFDRRAVEWTR